MVDNQHRRISGYRDLSEEEIALMNEIKEKGAELKQLLKKVGNTVNVDGRCVAIARTELQTGMMWLTRAVAKPEGF